MRCAAKAKLARIRIHAPAGEGARHFLDVLLAVIAFAKREQLHHFTRKIFVRGAFAILRAVEINQHRRIF